MKISLSTDLDGFLSQECPSCKQIFKVVLDEDSEAAITFCPYCGYEGQDCWWTQEQADYMATVAFNAFIKPELNKLSKASTGLLNIDVKHDFPSDESSPIDVERDFEVYHFPCHGETVKAYRHEKLFCIICGQEKDVKMSEAKKVFLSHKTIDKSLVIDIKEALEALGYEPWLDEDAMPAGASLDRAILQGMQESCGVVFFITSSFEDEGFLEQEINYAMGQKRNKKEKFAIITLQFSDEQGNSGEIPELLKQYVWKTPRNTLQALKEIIRALPIGPGTIDWKEDIEGVVTLPSIKSRTTELSEEAKALLLNAAEDDGIIQIMSYLGGMTIYAGQKSFPPSPSSPREISRWEGGVDDLERHGLIKRKGSKGVRCEVTREGYETFDWLKEMESKD